MSRARLLSSGRSPPGSRPAPPRAATNAMRSRALTSRRQSRCCPDTRAQAERRASADQGPHADRPAREDEGAVGRRPMPGLRRDRRNAVGPDGPDYGAHVGLLPGRREPRRLKQAREVPATTTGSTTRTDPVAARRRRKSRAWRSRELELGPVRGRGRHGRGDPPRDGPRPADAADAEALTDWKKAQNVLSFTQYATSTSRVPSRARQRPLLRRAHGLGRRLSRGLLTAYAYSAVETPDANNDRPGSATSRGSRRSSRRPTSTAAPSRRTSRASRRRASRRSRASSRPCPTRSGCRRTTAMPPATRSARTWRRGRSVSTRPRASTTPR